MNEMTLVICKGDVTDPLAVPFSHMYPACASYSFLYSKHPSTNRNRPKTHQWQNHTWPKSVDMTSYLGDSWQRTLSKWQIRPRPNLNISTSPSSTGLGFLCIPAAASSWWTWSKGICWKRSQFSASIRLTQWIQVLWSVEVPNSIAGLASISLDPDGFYRIPPASALQLVGWHPSWNRYQRFSGCMHHTHPGAQGIQAAFFIDHMPYAVWTTLQIIIHSLYQTFFPFLEVFQHEVSRTRCRNTLCPTCTMDGASKATSGRPKGVPEASIRAATCCLTTAISNEGNKMISINKPSASCWKGKYSVNQ